MKSKYGVLLSISSLPGDFGIGDFGECAYRFVDFLKNKGFRYWQILPINPIGPGSSPYMSSCSEAIEERYIDLWWLYKRGLISQLEKMPEKNRTNYGDVWNYKKPLLQEAFENFVKKPSRAYMKFKKNNKWVYSYSVFSVFREINHYSIWNTWDEQYLNYYAIHSYDELPNGLENKCEFIIFCQYIARLQFNELRKYLKKKGILLIADCPFYVGLDSVDCWMNKEQFLFDGNFKPTFVGGCPPDAFSDDGQLWGTPIYDFEKMKKDNFSFLVNRIGYLSNTCDYLRLDHFRACDSYCVIPAEDTNAKRGKWLEGPGHNFLDSLLKKYPKIKLVAEDLGDLFPGVHELRDFYKLPGMFVLQFTLFDDCVSNANQIVYTGTHDNDTLVGWINSLSIEQQEFLKKKFDNHNLFDAITNFALSLPSFITIIPMQDILGLNSYARMNFPGTVGSPNWEWKMTNLDYKTAKNILKK